MRGRPRIFTGSKLQQLVTLFNYGMTMEDLAAHYDVCTPTINDAIKRARSEGMEVLRERRRRPSRNAAVMELRQQGLSFSQIAERVRTTRSAVAGIVFRSRQAA